MFDRLFNRIGRTKFRIVLVISVSFVCATVLLVVYSLSPKNRSEYFRRGIQRYREREYSSAISDLTRAINLTPAYDSDSQESAYSARGIAFIAAGEPRKGVNDLSTAIAINPGEPQNYAFRAIGYRCLGQYAEALQDWKRRLEIIPGDRQSLEEEIYLQCDLKDYEAAYACALNLARKQPSDGLAVFFPGYVCFEWGRNEEAVIWLCKSIELDRGLAYAYFIRGYCYFRQGDFTKAESDRQVAITLDSSFCGKQYEAEPKLREPLFGLQ